MSPTVTLAHPLAEEAVADLWCVAYAAPTDPSNGTTDIDLDVIAYAMRGGIPDLHRCTFAARRHDGRWLVAAVGGTSGRTARTIGAWADWVWLQARSQARPLKARVRPAATTATPTAGAGAPTPPGDPSATSPGDDP
jgi:hypothetical protein